MKNKNSIYNWIIIFISLIGGGLIWLIITNLVSRFEILSNYWPLFIICAIVIFIIYKIIKPYIGKISTKKIIIKKEKRALKYKGIIIGLILGVLFWAMMHFIIYINNDFPYKDRNWPEGYHYWHH